MPVIGLEDPGSQEQSMFLTSGVDRFDTQLIILLSQLVRPLARRQVTKK
jgi:hypothetical protein